MVTITNPVLTTVTVNGLANVTLTATIADNVYRYVGGTITWGDGTSTAIPRQATPAAIGASHTYNGSGNFSVLLVGQNFSIPTPQTAQWEGNVSYFSTPTGLPPVPVTNTAFTYIGPILPRSNGLPNSTTWDWDLGTDALVLEASLRLLMTTNYGEYLMDANYGANLRTLVFSMNDAVLTDVIKSDILAALVNYEPRATLRELDFSQSGNTAVVKAIFSSILAPGSIPLSLTYTA